MLNLRRHIGSRVRLTNKKTGELIIVQVLEIEDGPNPNVLLGFSDDNHSFEIRRVDAGPRLRTEWPAVSKRA